MPKKLKVLVNAYACEPDKGSEPGVGWNWAKFAEMGVFTLNRGGHQGVVTTLRDKLK